MGDRSGLTKHDRTNGYDNSHDYMRVKKSKLAQQNDQIRDALRNRNITSKTDIFKGISISVNGRTQPTADELKRLILLNGGDYHPYYRYKTTKFMIATNLSIARMKQLRPDDRIIRPEWITDSIQVKCLLPYEDYQLFVEEPRGIQRPTVLTVEAGQLSSTQDQLIPVAVSYTRSYRKTNQKNVTKYRDIREMLSKSTMGFRKSTSLFCSSSSSSLPSAVVTQRVEKPIDTKSANEEDNLIEDDDINLKHNQDSMSPVSNEILLNTTTSEVSPVSQRILVFDRDPATQRLVEMNQQLALENRQLWTRLYQVQEELHDLLEIQLNDKQSQLEIFKKSNLDSG